MTNKAPNTTHDLCKISRTYLCTPTSTPTDGALQSGGPLHVDVTALLLARGADPNAVDREGRTPLDYARANGHWLAVELLTAWSRGLGAGRPG
ncbi:ankyrin repeat domain-containing protein [Micromonospora sp. NPDC049081]|uniref:ankyrin repeat domain-containing protein n=1 Tax=Micromonospora sp. NPDC049081 TaxID=3155150 RepID=UPI0033F52287